jgi:hypothetical protein
MKLFKIAFAAIACLLIGGFRPIPLLAVTYYYKSGTAYQRLQWGHTTDLPLCERTINCTVFTNVNNWTTSVQSYTSTDDLSKYIAAITFAEESTADGGSDGQLTLQEATSAVCAAFTSNQAMPESITVEGFAVVYVSAATACH